MKKSALMTAACTGLMLLLAAGLATVARINAQSAPAAPSPAGVGATGPTFEVASVKPNKSGDQRVMMQLPPTGRLTATNIPLRLLLRQAYDVQDFQIVGGPNWLNSDRFDIVAKTPEGMTSPEQIRPMLRALLADRFKLVAHNETREMPIYSLVTARSDGKLGPKLSVARVDCQSRQAARRGGPPPALPQPGQPIECGAMMGPGNLNVGGMPMSELARSLSPLVGRIVIDKTDLKGTYDFQLTFAPEGRGFGPGPGPGGAEPPAVDPNTPSLFTALQEQLGLKLESERGSVEVVVIDRVEQPTED
jgi:bla regulator protein blaR1